MKIFKKKEEKKKIGRPKLADSKLKKNAIIISSICIVMVLGLVLGGLFDLNIIGIKKIKGETVLNFSCNEMSPELANEFDDMIFYSYVINAIPNSTEEMCKTATKDDLKQVHYINVYDNVGITSIKGISNLVNLWQLDLDENPIKIYDLSNNPNLSNIFIGKFNWSETDTIILKNNDKIKRIFNGGCYSTGCLGISGTVNNLILEDNASINEIDRNLIINNNLRVVNSMAPNTTKTKNIYIDNPTNSSLYVSSSEAESIEIYNYDYNVSVNGTSPNLKNVIVKNAPNLVSLGLNISNLEEYYFDNLNNITDLSLSSNNNKNVFDYSFFNQINNIKTLTLDNVSFKNTNNVVNLSNYKNLTRLTIKNGLYDKVVYEQTEDTIDKNSLHMLINNNNINEIKLMMLKENVLSVNLNNNNINTIDLSNSKLPKMFRWYPSKQYVQKGTVFDFSKMIKFNSEYNVTYESNNESVINNNVLAKELGYATIKYIVEGLSGTIELPIEVYDIDSSKYDVNTTTKEIDVNNLSLDLNKIEITSDDLTKEVVGDKLYIKAGNRVVEIYTLKNIKKNTPIIEDKKEVTTTTTTKKTTKKYVRPTTNKKEESSEIKETTTIKNDTVSNNNEINEVTKVIYKNNNKLLLIINGIEGVLLIILLTLLIRNIKRS